VMVGIYREGIRVLRCVRIGVRWIKWRIFLV
jgi:hypothetical protein